ncbi:MAG: hypothetical protein AAF802_22415 [Planctomycetota bacterium]
MDLAFRVGLFLSTIGLLANSCLAQTQRGTPPPETKKTRTPKALELSSPAVISDPADPFEPLKKPTPKTGPLSKAQARTAVSSFAIPPVDDRLMELRIDAALDDETSNTFIETPLVEAMQQISELHNIPIVIDRFALEEIGLDQQIGVTLSLKGVSLRSFLRLMIRDMDLTYHIADEVLQITTIQASENNLRLKMYRLPAALAKKGEELPKLIQTYVVPDTWEALGSLSTISVVDHVLIVSTTTEVQDQVGQFLARLATAHAEGPAD